MTLGEILRAHGEAYQRAHPLRPAQSKVLRDLRRCRTAELGGHHQWCETCGFERYWYHSCRNRHCPQCQTQARAAWVEARQAELLPVPYFHTVFTLPHELNALILFCERNQRVLLKLLFDATAGTLMEFGHRAWGGRMGFTLVLHTWDQQLRPHFHLHGLIASGALARDGSRWIAGGAQFLFPVRALSRVFRGKYLDGLAKLLEENRLDVPTQLSALAEPGSRGKLLHRWRKKAWVVYCKAPFAGPRKLLDYLGRYTYRVALSNHRIVSCEEGQVRFTWRDRREGDRMKVRTLPVEEFLRRFFQHVLPDRLVRIRHYGFLANCCRKASLVCCRELLGVSPRPGGRSLPSSLTQWLREVLGLDLDHCPCCGERLCSEALLPEHHGTTPTEGADILLEEAASQDTS